MRSKLSAAMAVLVMLLALLAAGSSPCTANDHCANDDCADDCAERSYGPCACEPRKTLFQWSYGTGFSGGPPGPDEPLVTDRPDFTEASTTVGRGVAQVEMGYTYFFDREDGEVFKAHSYPEMLWRIGLFAEWFELRIAYNHGGENLFVAGEPPTSNTGAEDIYLGVKLGLTPQEGLLPEMALIPQMFVPTGHSAFTAHEVLPGVNWVYSWKVNDFISTGGSTQTNRAVDDGSGRAYWEWAQSWTIGYSLTKRFGAYTEYFGLYPTSADTQKPENYFNGGFTYLVNNNVQLDIRAGVGLNRAAIDEFYGSGFSIRF